MICIVTARVARWCVRRVLFRELVLGQSFSIEIKYILQTCTFAKSCSRFLFLDISRAFPYQWSVGTNCSRRMERPHVSLSAVDCRPPLLRSKFVRRMAMWARLERRGDVFVMVGGLGGLLEGGGLKRLAKSVTTNLVAAHLALTLNVSHDKLFYKNLRKALNSTLSKCEPTKA